METLEKRIGLNMLIFKHRETSGLMNKFDWAFREAKFGCKSWA